MELSNSILEEFESITSIRHKSALPPKDAYLYFPSENDQIQVNIKEPSKSSRMIFEGVEFTEFENKYLNLPEIKSLLKELDEAYPNYWENCHILRFLQATKFDIKKTIKILKDHNQWRINYLPIIPSIKIKEILNSGFIYVHGRDNRFRPIIVIDPVVFINLQKNYIVSDWLDSVYYLITYIIKYCLLPGQIENWVILCDLKDVKNIIFLPSELFKILGQVQLNSRCRVIVAHVFSVSSLFQFLWNALKKVLDETTQNKVRFYKTGNEGIEEVLKTIHPSQIEQKFGGRASNIERKYFPPIFPSNEYFTGINDPELVSPKKYLEIVSKNAKLKKSPYISSDKNDFSKEPNNQELKSEMSVYEDANSFSKKELESEYHELSICAEKDCRKDHFSNRENQFNKIEMTIKDDNFDNKNNEKNNLKESKLVLVPENLKVKESSNFDENNEKNDECDGFKKSDKMRYDSPERVTIFETYTTKTNNCCGMNRKHMQCLVF